MKCLSECRKNESACTNRECRHWIDYGQDLNCSINSADLHGPMTLDEISKRMGMSLVRVKQIEQAALDKLKKRNKVLTKDMLHE